MDIHSLTPLLPTVIVFLLLFGGYLLLLQVLKIPLSVRSRTLDQAIQGVYLANAFISLLAGALWIVAWATAQFIGTWREAFLGLGAGALGGGIALLFTRKSSTLGQAGQRVYFKPAFLLLMVGALWIVAHETAQFIGTWGIAFLSLGIVFLSLGIVFLIRGLRWKAGEKP